MSYVALELDRIRLTYGIVAAINDVSLSVGRGEFVTLLGPSGSGKTSTLRIVGGFEKPTSGTVWIGGEKVNDRPPYARDTATIFQNGALFPHKTVAQNIAYGLRMRRVPQTEIERRVREILAIVALSGYEDRYPAAMSGGQRQRVALARSLVVRPTLLLFDEPMSALDLALRLQLRAEIKRLHKELGFSAIFVTHDQGEAMSVSDRVAVMAKGQIEQIGRPEEVYRHPANEFVFTFMGESCLLPVRIDGCNFLGSSGQTLPLTLAAPPGPGEWRIYVRPGNIRLLPKACDGLPNRLEATVQMVEYLGGSYRYHVQASGLSLVCDSSSKLGFGPGDAAVASWLQEDMRCFQ